METMKLVLPLNEEMTAIRRHIHQHPELSNEEFETTKLIREKLTEYGIEIAEIGLKTGVLGILRGKKPGKTVAIREDIDALPMPELTEERRKEYVKLAKGKAEDGKVAVRNIRRKAKESLDKAIKDGEMGEDEGDRLLKELDKITKQTTDELDTLLEAKQKEIMEV